MNQKWLGVRTFISMCLAIGWWDIWYPELTEAAGVYHVVYEDGTVQNSQEVVECELSEYTYLELLSMDSDRIRIRFRFLEWIEEYFEKG